MCERSKLNAEAHLLRLSLSSLFIFRSLCSLHFYFCLLHTFTPKERSLVPSLSPSAAPFLSQVLSLSYPSLALPTALIPTVTAFINVTFICHYHQYQYCHHNYHHHFHVIITNTNTLPAFLTFTFISITITSTNTVTTIITINSSLPLSPIPVPLPPSSPSHYFYHRHYR